MTTVYDIRSFKRKRCLGANLFVVASLTCVPAMPGLTYGAPPIQPTLPPFYSFDAASPSVLDGTVGSADVLLPGGTNPTVVVPGNWLGLVDPNDDLNALSAPNTGVGTTQTFAILFSIDRASTGDVAPDSALATLGVPYNASDQASKGQAAGDQFISLSLFTRAGGPLSARSARVVDNNVLLRNNYDEGGVDFSADPTSSAEDDATGSSEDNVNATSGTSTSAARGAAGPVFFSASAESPSLNNLSGGMPSGATLYYNPNPAPGGADTSPFASFADLGLVATDDIGATIVFENGDGVLNAQDQIVFSLERGSPSLQTLIAGEVASPADLFSVTPGSAPQRFATAADFGLDPLADNIDALDFLPCTDARACAELYGIRRPTIPTVSAWGLILMVMLVLTSGSVIFIRRRAIVS